MKNLLRALQSKKTRQRIKYALLLEANAAMAIVWVTFLGEKMYALFGLSFLLSITVGVVTTMYFWRLQDRAIEDGVQNKRSIDNPPADVV